MSRRNTEFDAEFVGDDRGNSFYGSSGNDRMVGVDGFNLFRQGVGDWTGFTTAYGNWAVGNNIDFAQGADTIIGGIGLDTLWYRGQLQSITVDISAGTSLLRGECDRFESIEYFSLGSGNDRVVSLGDALAVDGFDGRDTLDLRRLTKRVELDFVEQTAVVGRNPIIRIQNFENANGAKDAKNLLRANDGKNELIGGNLDDRLMAFGGNDTLYGGGGDDILNAGDGRDVIYGEGGNDTIVTGEGYDVIYGGAGNDNIVDYQGRTDVDGGSGDDKIKVNEYNAIVDAGSGDDRVSTLRYSREPNDPLTQVRLGAGADRVDAAGGEIWGGAGADDISGGTFAWGQAGADSFFTYYESTFYGGNGRDTFDLRGEAQAYGQSGDDTFLINQAEVVYGGGGDDVFRFYGRRYYEVGAADIIFGGPGHDVLYATNGSITLGDFRTPDDVPEGVRGAVFGVEEIHFSDGADYLRIIGGVHDVSLLGGRDHGSIVSDNCILRLGEGGDSAHASGSNNVFFGGEGRDAFNANEETARGNVFYGEVGADYFGMTAGNRGYGGAGKDEFRMDRGGSAFGEDGEDRFTIHNGSAYRVDGGRGDDELSLRGTVANVDMGSGDDEVNMSAPDWYGDDVVLPDVTRIAVGSGADTVTVRANQYLDLVMLDLDAAEDTFYFNRALEDWNRIEEIDGNTILSHQIANSSGPGIYEQTIVFEGVTLAQLEAGLYIDP